MRSPNKNEMFAILIIKETGSGYTLKEVIEMVYGREISLEEYYLFISKMKDMREGWVRDWLKPCLRGLL